MKVFLMSAVAIVAISLGAANVLNGQFQTDSKTAYTTEGLRLSTGDAASK